MLEGGVVIGVEVIEPHNPLAPVEQRFSDGGADEAGGAGEEGAGACRTGHRDDRGAGLAKQPVDHLSLPQ